MRKNNLFYRLCATLCLAGVMLVTYIAPALASGEQAVKVDEDNYIYVKGNAGAQYGGKKITMLLCDKERVSPANIIYVNEKFADSSGGYTFKIPCGSFNFRFDESGAVNNAELYVNADGVPVNYSVTEALVKEQLIKLVPFSYTGDAVSIKIDNPYIIKDGSAVFVVAGYDDSGRLIDVDFIPKAISQREDVAELDVDFSEAVKSIKVFTFNSVEAMLPLANAAKTGGENIIPNNGFELDITNTWFSGNFGSVDIGFDETQAYSGEGSIRFNSSYQHYGIRSAGFLIPLSESGSGTYRFICFAKSEAGTNVKAVLYLRDKTGEYRSIELCPYTVVDSEWTKIEGISDIELTGDEIDAYIEIVSSGKKVDVYADDVFFGAELAAKQIEDSKTRIILVGDSLCTWYDDTNDKRGWGQIIGDRVNNTLCTLMNTATGGWSTKTYLEGRNVTNGRIMEGERWSTISGLLRENDYVLISLAHNDAAGPYQISADEYKENLLKMVNDVKAAGAVPVFVTAVPRVADGDWTSEYSIRNSYAGTYAGYMKEVAGENGVRVFDLHTALKDKYAVMGKTTTLTYYVDDRIHVNPAGAELVSNTIVDLIKNSDCYDLIRYFN